MEVETHVNVSASSSWDSSTEEKNCRVNFCLEVSRSKTRLAPLAGWLFEIYCNRKGPEYVGSYTRVCPRVLAA